MIPSVLVMLTDLCSRNSSQVRYTSIQLPCENTVIAWTYLFYSGSSFLYISQTSDDVVFCLLKWLSYAGIRRIAARVSPLELCLLPRQDIIFFILITKAVILRYCYYDHHVSYPEFAVGKAVRTERKYRQHIIALFVQSKMLKHFCVKSQR